MPVEKPTCFFLMPFTPEMNFLYLYLKDHLDRTVNVICERADERATTVQLLEKVKASIQKAGVIVAVCTGANPNVFYEIGVAHAIGKDVILLTGDPIANVPSDLRGYDFIQYDLKGHAEFLSKLDATLETVLEKRYDEHFRIGRQLFDQFRAVCPEAQAASKKEFVGRYRAGEITGEVGEALSAAKLLTFIVQNSGDPPIMEKILRFVPTEKLRPGDSLAESPR